MTPPRQVLYGSTYLITKKCILDRYGIRPGDEINAILLYCLLVAAERTGIRLHAFCFMSNHWHAVLTDPQARLPEFMHHFGLHTAKAINAAFGTLGPVWSSDKYVATRLLDIDAAIRKVVYTLANPVNAEVVERPEEWPGITSAKYKIGEQIRCRRPGPFFAKSSHFPEVVEGRLESLAGVFEAPPSPAEIEARIENELGERVATIENRVRESVRRFAGSRSALRAPRSTLPATPRGRSSLHPQVASRDTEVRVDVLQAILEFRQEYARALNKFRGGDREVEFPAGTYAVRVHLRLNCKSPMAA